MLKIEQLLRTDAPQAQYGKVWLPARPERFHSIPSLVRDLWAVFRGRAEAVQWPEQRDGQVDLTGVQQDDHPTND